MQSSDTAMRRIAMPVEEPSTASLAVVDGPHGKIVTDTDQSAYVSVTSMLSSVKIGVALAGPIRNEPCR